MKLPFLDRLLDLSVVYSFDRTGFERHSASFPSDAGAGDLRSKTCLVTGANSGIGRAVALALARRDAEVWMLCRDKGRGEEAKEAIRQATGNDRIVLEVLDVSDLDQVRAFAERLPLETVDVLVHNAGALVHRRVETREGHELTFATHVLGPFLLTRLLLPRLARAASARVVHVSSGGMYLRPLSLSDPQFKRRRFDGIIAYAEAKRAQVVLSEMWAEKLRDTPIRVAAMHPGWAATVGVERALPGFFRWMNRRLRTPEQGADTVVWLATAPPAAVPSGRFWLDRAEQPTHVLPWTRASDAARAALWNLCASLTSAPPL
jgi:dehydrogenase/reductase SDR family member 12